jgi:uncharacterized protein
MRRGDKSPGPIRVVQHFLDMVFAHDVNKALDMLTDDVVLHVQGAPNVPTIGIQHGKEEVRSWLELFRLNLQPLYFKTYRFFESGDEVVLIGGFRCLVLATGNEVSSEFAAHCVTRGGKVAAYKCLEDSYALYRAFQKK